MAGLLETLTECERPLDADARTPIGFLTECKLRVGDGAEAAFEWARAGAAAGIDVFRDVAEAAIGGVVAVLQDPPNNGWLRDVPRREVEYLYNPDWHPFVVIGLLTALTFAFHRRIGLAALVLLGFLFVVNQGYWEETSESLTLVLFSCLVCMAIGVPLGIAAAHRPALYRGMRPVLDLMQTLPTFVYLIPAIVFFGIGMVPGLIATVIFVLAAPIRLTHLGISSTPKPLIEAVEAFGGTGRDVLWKAELPHALPQIMTGLNQTIMLSLSMVVIAALVGADGLGVPVVRALNSVNTGLGFESGIVIVVVAILLDRVLRVDRR